MPLEVLEVLKQHGKNMTNAGKVIDIVTDQQLSELPAVG